MVGGSSKKITNNKSVGGLPQLKLGCRSEFSKNIRTYNTAVNTSMNRDLAQSLRDVHNNIENLKRSQQSTYKNMCRVSYVRHKKCKLMKLNVF